MQIDWLKIGLHGGWITKAQIDEHKLYEKAGDMPLEEFASLVMSEFDKLTGINTKSNKTANLIVNKLINHYYTHEENVTPKMLARWMAKERESIENGIVPASLIMR